MKNKHIIKKNFEFQEIIGLQRKIMNSAFVICYRPSSLPHLRYGISVGKKIAKKSYQRNLIKRQIRAIMHDFLRQQEIPNHDIIIMVRLHYFKNNFQANKKMLDHLLTKLAKKK